MRNRINLFTILVTFICLLLAGCTQKPAIEATSGSCGENLTWDYDSKTQTLTIEGSGEMEVATYVWSHIPIKEVIFPEGLTSIGDDVFYGNYQMTAPLNLPSTLKTIAPFAFYGCEIPGEITFPEGLESIGNYAFNGCKSITAVHFPSTLTYIGEDCFYQCEALEGQLILPEGLITIGSGAFDHDEGLTGDLVIPDSVESIGYYAFAWCGFDGTLTLSESLTAIENNTFQGLESIKGDLIIPENVRTIGESAFSGSSFDGSLSLPSELDSIGRYAFDRCSKLKGAVSIPEGISIIDKNAFASCESLQQVSFPSGLRYISSQAFSYCKNLKSIGQLPEGLLVIGNRAFEGCGSLEELPVFPSTLESIGEDAFIGCDRMTGLPQFPSSLQQIRSGAFYGCISLAGDLIIPEGVCYLGDDAFRDCPGFTSVSIGSTVRAIGGGTFLGCDSLKEVNFAGDKINYFQQDESEEEYGRCLRTFPEGLDLMPSTDFPKADSVKASLEKNDKAGEDDGDNSSQSETPWYWTDQINGSTFYTVGRQAYLTLYIYDKEATLYANGQEYCRVAFDADPNGEMVLKFHGLYCPDGRIDSLEYRYGQADCLSGKILAADGGEEELIFFGGYDYSDEDRYLALEEWDA